VLALSLLNGAPVHHCYRGHVDGGGGLPDRSGAHRVSALALDARGATALSAAAGVLRRWDLRTGGCTAEGPHQHKAEVRRHPHPHPDPSPDPTPTPEPPLLT
jgi:hypothetical protein